MGRPMMQDIYGLAKWQHWRDLDGKTQDAAGRKYAELVEKHRKKYKINSDCWKWILYEIAANKPNLAPSVAIFLHTGENEFN